MKGSNQSNYLSQVEQIASAGIDVGLQLTLDGGSVPHETLPTETVKETVAIFKQHKQLKQWQSLSMS